MCLLTLGVGEKEDLSNNVIFSSVGRNQLKTNVVFSCVGGNMLETMLWRSERARISREPFQYCCVTETNPLLSSQAVTPCGDHDETVGNFKPPLSKQREVVLSPGGRRVGDVSTNLEEVRIQEHGGHGVCGIKF